MTTTTTNAQPLGILRGFSAFIVWVGGSLAGISAILYACGYLATRAHLSMLGLGLLVDYGNNFFLQEGARFVISAGYSLLRTLLPIAVILGVIAGVVFAIYSPLRNRAFMQKLRSVASRWTSGSWWLYASYAILFILLALHAGRYLDAFEQPLLTVNMLYTDVGALSVENPVNRLGCWILTENRAALGRAFEDLLFALVTMSLLTYLAWRVVSRTRMRILLVSPFIAATVMYVVTLPMAYGVLQKPPRYPVGTLTLSAGPPRTAFLLERSADSLVVWDATLRRVSLVPVRFVERVEVSNVEPIFTRTNSSSEAKGQAICAK